MMNCTKKVAILFPEANFSRLQSSFFHATPVLERKRRNFWDSSSQRSNSYSRRSRKLHSKQSLLRNFNRYADFIFQDWGHASDEEFASSSKDSSWFRKQYSGGSTKGRAGNPGGRRGGKSFQFCEDDFEVESIFRSAFGGNRFFYWSFINEEESHGRNSSTYSKSQRNWRHRFEEDYDSSDSESESNSSESSLTSDRLALGLSAVGPLKLEDVKKAYRTCALKWHPDRHQGSSKAVAEQKFKVCSAAYQSLCDRLAAA